MLENNDFSCLQYLCGCNYHANKMLAFLDKFHAVELCFVHEKSFITFRAWFITGREVGGDNYEPIFL